MKSITHNNKNLFSASKSSICHYFSLKIKL